MSEKNTSEATATQSPVVRDLDPIGVERTVRVIGGTYCDCGYDFIEAAATEGWKAVSSWGLDGWDLGDWPYVVYAFRGDTERATYCEGDITLETFASREARERATDEAALFYWRDEPWMTRDPADLSGPFTWARLDASKV